MRVVEIHHFLVQSICLLRAMTQTSALCSEVHRYTTLFPGKHELGLRIWLIEGGQCRGSMGLESEEDGWQV